MYSREVNICVQSKAILRAITDMNMNITVCGRQNRGDEEHNCFLLRRVEGIIYLFFVNRIMDGFSNVGAWEHQFLSTF